MNSRKSSYPSTALLTVKTKESFFPLGMVLQPPTLDDLKQ